MYDFDEIKEHYQRITPLIMEVSSVNVKYWVDPYRFSKNWNTQYSPIEESMWMDIRSFGKVPMYPQYPIDRYFVDFGNPYTKIAIECDGKEFHKDKHKDHLRDLYLAEQGRIVYRISGADCIRVLPDFDNLEDLDSDDRLNVCSDYFDKTAGGLIRSIAIYHFGWIPFYNDECFINLGLKCLNERISIKGQLDEVKVDLAINRFYKFYEHD